MLQHPFKQTEKQKNKNIWVFLLLNTQTERETKDSIHFAANTDLSASNGGAIHIIRSALRQHPEVLAMHVNGVVLIPILACEGLEE